MAIRHPLAAGPFRLAFFGHRGLAWSRPGGGRAFRGAARHLIAGRRASSSSAGKSRRKAAAKASRWHAPSFLAGLAVGICFVLLTVLAPEYFSEQATNLSKAVEERAVGATEELVFHFEDLLPNSEVPSQPERYGPGRPPEEAAAPAEPPPPAPPPARAFHIQVASFPQREDAEQLRARLLLQAMPAQTAKVDLENGAWYRVVVGPIASADEAERTMNALREQKFAALWIRRS